MTKVHRKASGFTLLELSVVILLMAIMLGFSFPRFSTLFDSTLLLETQKIARLVKQMRLQAILNGENIKLVFDTKKSQYSVMTADSTSPAQYSPHEKHADPIHLPESLDIYKVTQNVPEDKESRFSVEKIEFDKIFGQTYEFNIDSSGFIDIFTLKIKDKDNKITLSVVNIMGKIVIGEELPL